MIYANSVLPSDVFLTNVDNGVTLQVFALALFGALVFMLANMLRLRKFRRCRLKYIAALARGKDTSGRSRGSASSVRLCLCPPKVRPVIVDEHHMPRFERVLEQLLKVEPSSSEELDRNAGCQNSARQRLIGARLCELRQAAAEFQSDANAAGSWRLHEPVDDILLSRLLLATDLDVQRSKCLLRSYVTWRRQETFGGVPPHLCWLKLGVALVPFKDKMGRPIVLIRLKYADTSVPIETVQKLYRGVVDVAIAEMLSSRSEDGDVSRTNPLEQYALVLDARGASRQNFTLAWIKLMVRESNRHYPDRLAQVLVLGTNSMVASLWKVASVLLHERTRKKVQLVASRDVNATMRELVQEGLTSDYGGSLLALPSPPGADAATSAVVAGAGPLALCVWQHLPGMLDSLAVSSRGADSPGSPALERTSTLPTCKDQLGQFVKLAGAIFGATP